MKISYVKNKKYYFISVEKNYVIKVFNSKELSQILKIDQNDYLEESKKYRSKMRGKTIYFDDVEKIKLFIEWIEGYLILNKLSE